MTVWTRNRRVTYLSRVHTTKNLEHFCLNLGRLQMPCVLATIQDASFPSSFSLFKEGWLTCLVPSLNTRWANLSFVCLFKNNFNGWSWQWNSLLLPYVRWAHWLLKSGLKAWGNRSLDLWNIEWKRNAWAVNVLGWFRLGRISHSLVLKLRVLPLPIIVVKLTRVFAKVFHMPCSDT